MVTWNIARHLAKKNHKVHVITSGDVSLKKESLEEGFKVHRLRYPKVRFFGFLVFFIKTLLTLKKINPDIVHAQSFLIGLNALVFKKLFGKPYLLSDHGAIYFNWSFRNQISKLVMRDADGVVALTDDMKKEMLKVHHREIHVVPNGIDLEIFETLPRDEVRQRLHIKAEEKLIIFVGRLRPEKGLNYLLNAMEIIKQKEHSAKLILVGGGPEESHLELLAEKLELNDCVKFVGQIPNERVSEYMAASDIFILPSLSEGFPVVILEAMASGLPIVTTRVTGLPEIVNNGENGFLVEPRNPQQLAEKILLLFRENGLREEISRNNKEKVKKYDWKIIIDELEGIYQSCL